MILGKYRLHGLFFGVQFPPKPLGQRLHGQFVKRHRAAGEAIGHKNSPASGLAVGTGEGICFQLDCNSKVAMPGASELKKGGAIVCSES